MGQRKAFYRQRIPEFTCARKQTADIDILITSRHGDRKIRQSFKIRSRHPSRKRIAQPVQPILKNIYQSNTHRKDLRWPHFNDEPRVQEKEQVKDQQPCLFVFVACLTIPSSNQGYQPRRDNSISYMSVWQIYRDTEQRQEKETSQNELRLQFSGSQFQQWKKSRSCCPFQRRKSTPAS